MLQHEKQEVVVTDIRMSFGSMVMFMIKWAIAAIPAFLILSIVVGIIVSVLAVIPGLLIYNQ